MYWPCRRDTPTQHHQYAWKTPDCPMCAAHDINGDKCLLSKYSILEAIYREGSQPPPRCRTPSTTRYPSRSHRTPVTAVRSVSQEGNLGINAHQWRQPGDEVRFVPKQGGKRDRIGWSARPMRSLPGRVCLHRFRTLPAFLSGSMIPPATKLDTMNDVYTPIH